MKTYVLSDELKRRNSLLALCPVKAARSLAKWKRMVAWLDCRAEESWFFFTKDFYEGFANVVRASIRDLESRQ